MSSGTSDGKSRRTDDPRIIAAEGENNPEAGGLRGQMMWLDQAAFCAASVKSNAGRRRPGTNCSADQGKEVGSTTVRTVLAGRVHVGPDVKAVECLTDEALRARGTSCVIGADVVCHGRHLCRQADSRRLVDTDSLVREFVERPQLRGKKGRPAPISARWHPVGPAEVTRHGSLFSSRLGMAQSPRNARSPHWS
jgi:hypothetical protein